MFGLSWAQIAVIVLVGVFLLGPERIPTAVQWVVSSLKKVRTMAAGAQAQLRGEIGPELEELRRQVADLQSLKELQELKELRNLHPRKLIGQTLLGGEDLSFKGLLGVDPKAQVPLTGSAGTSTPTTPSTPAPSPRPTTLPQAAAPQLGVTPPPAAPSLQKESTAPRTEPSAPREPAARPAFDPDAT